MITDLVIENFQSVGQVSLRLGRLTVVTGPTGSGKTAVIRALHLAAFNHRGTSFIRHGQSTCKVAFGPWHEGWCIGIERGSVRGRDSYRVSRFSEKYPEDPDPVSLKTYTKLGGEAPPEVLAVHGLTGLNFAGQFDRPYLLDASGGEVARTLGDLTNVSLVFEAARLANQCRLRSAGDLRHAEAEVARLGVQLQQYAGLPARRAAVAQAEAALSRVQEARERHARLQGLITGAARAAEAAGRAEEAARAAIPPSLFRVEALAGRRARIAALVADHQHAREAAVRNQHLATRARVDENDAHLAIHECLAQAGTCPTCNLPVPR